MNEINFSPDAALLKIEKHLPVQGPIKDFIHLNILEKFMDKPFFEAVKEAGEIFNAASYMPFSYYRDKYKKNEISDKNIIDTIDELYPNIEKSNKGNLINMLHEYKSLEAPLKNSLFIRNSLFKKIGANLDHEVNPILFRFVGSYLDQGVALWHFMERSSFVDAIYNVTSKSKFPIAFFVVKKDFLKDLKSDTDQTINNILKQMLHNEEYFFIYIKESLISHRGWSGMVDIVSKRKKSLSNECNISLKEFFFVKLLLEYQAIKYLNKKFTPLLDEEIIFDKKDDDFKLSLLRIWQESLERNYYEKVEHQLKQTPAPSPKNPKFQAIFCLDDRESSTRRLLEEENPQIETFGTAGFFGVDTYLMSQKKSVIDKICPMPLEPNHIVLETNSDIKHPKWIPEDFLSITQYLTRHGANSFWLGFLAVQTLGHLSLFGILASFSHPKRLLFSKKQSSKALPTSINFIRDENNPKINHLWLGYTIDEMTERVYNTLRGIDLINNFAPMIFFIGHGSSSLNNPHFAAYDCGACSGRPGRTSARIICGMANLASVRQKLKEKNIIIPDETVFIATYHDTCTDEIEYYDIENLKEKQISLFDEFKTSISMAQKRNALERCQRFVLAKNVTLDNVMAEVKHRSQSLFEPRPELGHQKKCSFDHWKKREDLQI